jgi:hypothetical protein
MMKFMDININMLDKSLRFKASFQREMIIRFSTRRYFSVPESVRIFSKPYNVSLFFASSNRGFKHFSYSRSPKRWTVIWIFVIQLTLIVYSIILTIYVQLLNVSYAFGLYCDTVYSVLRWIHEQRQNRPLFQQKFFTLRSLIWSCKRNIEIDVR